MRKSGSGSRVPRGRGERSAVWLLLRALCHGRVPIEAAQFLPRRLISVALRGASLTAVGELLEAEGCVW